MNNSPPDWANLIDLVNNRLPEGLRVEFKLKSDQRNSDLHKDDRRNITRSVVAFANSDGGLLVIGVKTQKIDGFDCAHSLIKISNINAFRSAVENLIATQITPAIDNVCVFQIEDECAPGSGYLWITVPTSNSRPHMSIASSEHTFYKRGFNGSMPMTVSEIRDQILATRDALLDLKIETQGGSSSVRESKIFLGFRLKGVLQNIGAISARNAFVKLKSSLQTYSYDGPADRRGFLNWQLADGRIFTPGDEIETVGLNYWMAIDLISLSSSVGIGNRGKIPPAALAPHCNFLTSAHNLDNIGELAKFKDSIPIMCEYGAENSPMKRVTIERVAADLVNEIVSFHGSQINEILLHNGIAMQLSGVV